jgi:hypothetical protein
LDVSDWSAVLCLATLWKVQEIRDLAINELEQRVSPVEALVLARDYDVQHWLIPSYVSVCLQPEPLSLHEVKYLCILDLVIISRVRESILTGKCTKDTQSLSAYVGSLLEESEVVMSQDSSLLPVSSGARISQDSLKENLTRATTLTGMSSRYLSLKRTYPHATQR